MALDCGHSKTTSDDIWSCLKGHRNPDCYPGPCPDDTRQAQLSLGEEVADIIDNYSPLDDKCDTCPYNTHPDKCRHSLCVAQHTKIPIIALVENYFKSLSVYDQYLYKEFKDGLINKVGE